MHTRHTYRRFIMMPPSCTAPFVCSRLFVLFIVDLALAVRPLVALVALLVVVLVLLLLCRAIDVRTMNAAVWLYVHVLTRSIDARVDAAIARRCCLLILIVSLVAIDGTPLLDVCMNVYALDAPPRVRRLRCCLLVVAFVLCK